MKGLLSFLGMNVGGALGWWLGALHSITLAVVLSAVGSGVGLYWIHKLARKYLD